MSQFGKRVYLIHKLTELTGTEEFINHTYDGASVDQNLGGQGVDILNRHSLTNNAFHSS